MIRPGGDHDRPINQDCDRRRRKPRLGPRDRHRLGRGRRAGGRRVAHHCRVSRSRPAAPAPSRRRSPTPATPQRRPGLLERYEPEVVVLVAGASPHMRPLQQQTWETFSVNWQTDVRIAFHWLRQALLKPLRPGSRVIVFSSGAALAGSPLSGGYAGASGPPDTLHDGYAQDEAKRAGLGNHLHRAAAPDDPADGPRPGRRWMRTRSAPASPLEEYLEQMGPRTTPATAGSALVEPAGGRRRHRRTRLHLPTGAGLQELIVIQPTSRAPRPGLRRPAASVLWGCGARLRPLSLRPPWNADLTSSVISKISHFSRKDASARRGPGL